MGKRSKKTKKPGPKKAEPLATTFPCLFCNHEKSVTVKLDRKAGVGQLSCKVCGQSFQCSVNYLSAAVDVYSDWVDACDAIAKDNKENAGGLYQLSHRNIRDRTRLIEEDSNLDKNPGDEEDAGGYVGEGIVADDEY